LALALSGPAAAQTPAIPRPDILVPTPPRVRHYLVSFAATRPLVDGLVDEPAWHAAPWTAPFVDIEGKIRPEPRLRTRAKLLWDQRYLYVAAELEEPDLWATLTTRDAVIFRDHDFEIFLDPDGDTHGYFELEINALGTVWDLFLPKPYRDGGRAVDAWDIVGLESAVRLRGTLNDPSDRDTAWTVELAIPWSALAPPGELGRAPRDGEQWRVNFSRVEWDLVAGTEGRYAKRRDPATGNPAPEHNWVWAAQHAVNLHMPEFWGIAQFSATPAGGAPVAFRPPRDDAERWALRLVYYAQRAFRERHGRYARDLTELGAMVGGTHAAVVVAATDTTYVATAPGTAGRVWRIDHEGRLFRP
jgi:hypothetical protein